MALTPAQTLVLVDAAFSDRAMLWWGAGHDLGLAVGGVKVTSTAYLDAMPVSYVLTFAGVLLGAAGVIGIGGAVPYFEGRALLVPVAGALLAAFVWRQTRTAGALASPPGPGAPRGHLLATALVNAAVAALLMAVGHLRF
ncbi:hypothetical protein ACIGW0_22295 [Streptomyces bikiniensis]|uniref:Integral membrane protein n=1 Tax=Streptomyces bikiniensis TaxID=1896 RepID=A0ABW8D080_STRBI